MPIKLGCASITWNDFPHLTFDQALAEIAATGYVGCPTPFPTFDAAGQPATPPQAMADRYARFGLAPAPGYLSGDLWLPERRDSLIAAARHRARYSATLGLAELYVSASCPDFLLNVAGHATGRRTIGLPDASFDVMAATLNAMGAATLAEGVALCYHNHAGSYVETEAEYEALIARLDPATVWLGPDTGHLAIGGGDNTGFFARHAPRIRTAHLKDISGPILATGQREQHTYRQMVALGLFAELGQGIVDLAPPLASLRAANFSGWLIAETDHTMLPTAIQSASISRQHLHTLGL